MLRVAVLVFSLSFCLMSSAKNEYKQWNKANQLFFDKKYNEALKIYQKLESKHDLLEFKLQIARCYFYTNKKISALPWYEKVIEYPNINIEAYKEYAICLELKKRDAEALAYEKKYNELKKIQQVNKTNTPIIESFDATTNKEKVDKIKTKSNKEKLASINKKAVKDSLKVAKTVAEESIVTTKTTTSKSKKSKKNEAIEGLYYNIFLSSFLKDPGTSYYYDIEALGLFIKEKDGDNTLYYIGKYKDYETAEKYLQKIKEAGYENAYIQAYYNNKKVTLEKAQSLENNIE